MCSAQTFRRIITSKFPIDECGKSVSYARDSQGRITEITDPAGMVIRQDLLAIRAMDLLI
ncbi:MAG: RHS repeat protein [Clostridiaceae bacterium]|nr:RHS repeat protein [Clostridiaceae bacterium]